MLDKSYIAREYTEDEVRELMLNHIWHMIHYWKNEAKIGETQDEITERLSGLAFSILAMLDGSADLPKFIVAPDPHPSDKDYHRDNDENYYPENHKNNINCDVGGSLHDYFYSYKI